MTWLDQLQRASFRDVPFHVDTIDWTAGENVVIREYPFRDLPTVFTMGRAAEEFKLSAYVIGDDYTEQRDALAEALEGFGKLVHPTAGTMNVYVAGKFTVREAPTSEGGMARFDITFVRAEARPYPVGIPNPRAVAEIRADELMLAAVDDFAKRWSLAKAPGWVADLAAARIGESIDSLWAPLATAAASLGAFNSDLIAAYQVLRDDLNTAVGAPRRLAEEIANLFELPVELTNAAARSLQEAFRWMFTVSDRIAQADFEMSVMPAPGAGLVMFGTGTIQTVESPARVRLRGLQAAGDRLFESLATAAWVKAGSSVDLVGYDDAMASRQLINAQCVRLLTTASSEQAPDGLPVSSWHAAMSAMHAAVLTDLQARSRDLIRLTTYTPESWQPVLYISHRLYGTADYADEIMDMNPHIRHPLLAPPGVPLRVMRRA